MDPLLITVLLCILLGAVVGLMAGLLGIGGGLIIVPTLLLILENVLNIEIEHGMPIALATSLFTVIFTGLSSTRSHYKLGNIVPSIVLLSAAGIAIGSVAGAFFATSVSGVMLQRIFAVLVILIAAQMIFFTPKISNAPLNKVSLSCIGLGSGFIAALMGIGGGALIVPSLVWFQVNIKKAIGCASFCGVIIALFGSIGFITSGYNKNYLPAYSFGYVYLPAAFGIVLTSVFTAPIGAKLTRKFDTAKLKRVFAGFLVLVSIRMIIGLE